MTAEQFHYLTPFLRALLVEQHKVEGRFRGEPNDYWAPITGASELVARSALPGCEFRIVRKPMEMWINVDPGDKLTTRTAFTNEFDAIAAATKYSSDKEMRVAVHMREVIE